MSAVRSGGFTWQSHVRPEQPLSRPLNSHGVDQALPRQTERPDPSQSLGRIRSFKASCRTVAKCAGNVTDNGVQLPSMDYFSLFSGEEADETLYLAFAFVAMTRYHIAGLDYASPGSECVVLLMEPLVAETLWLPSVFFCRTPFRAAAEARISTVLAWGLEPGISC